MVRRKVIGRAGGSAALVGLIAALSLTALAAGQEPQAPGLLDQLLQRASATSPGTYVVTESSIDKSTAPLPVLVQIDVLKGTGKTIRVPIVVGADLPQAAEVRIRVVRVTPAGQAPRVIGTANGAGAAGHARFVHEFVLAPGEYESQTVVGGFRTSGGVTAVLDKSRFTVPDVWGTGLVATPIVLGEDLTKGKRGDLSPFNFGPTNLVPAVKARFPQSGSIRVAFRIFNWRAQDAEKPDVTVDYQFYEQGKRRLLFFNKSKPQQLTAATLGDAFDPASGVLNAGLLLPLGSFTFGDFKLKVSVTDNRSKQSTEQWVGFTVSP